MGKINLQTLITTYKQSGNNTSLTARTLGISPKTVRLWVRRARRPGGYLAYKHLKRRSTRPKHVQRALSPADEHIVVELRRKKRMDQQKIALILKQKHNISISPKTVYNIINRRDPTLISRKPGYQRPRFQNGDCMRPGNTKTIGYLQADTKHVTPELSGLGYTTYQFSFIDIHSRYKLGMILPQTDQEASITALRWVLKQMPFEVKFVQTDNGWEYGKRFSQECADQGVEHYYIHKSSPNENAVIERSFRTDQEEFYYYLESKPEDINDLNRQLQTYLREYNTERPHFGIDLQTPLEVVNSCLAQGGENVVTD